ncbi:M16 family metallopeptidase [Candidatus Margulisiibacteriota bacterium]
MSKEFKLENGAKVLCKAIPHAYSVSLGIYLTTRIVEEPLKLNGITHFLEHMSFKGTKKRTAKEIADILDSIGAQVNAHTAKEYTCYYLTVLSEKLFQGLEILLDIVLNSTLDQKDIDTEKKVVLEEINMYEDSPDENIHDIFASTLWHGHELGRPILGAEKTIGNITKENLEKFKNIYFNPKKMVISLAGNIPDEEKVIEKLNQILGSVQEKETFPQNHVALPTFCSRVNLQKKDTEQIHFCLGVQGIPYNHKDFFRLSVLSSIIGGTMSSRLFQNIREKEGYAYSIYSYPGFYKDTGLFSIYAGINKDKFLETLQLVLNEIKDLKENIISSYELKKTKEQFKGSFLIDLENTSSWMSWQARSMIYKNKIDDIETIIQRINDVTQKDIQELAQQLFKTENFALAAVGPFEDKKYPQENFQKFITENQLSFT